MGGFVVYQPNLTKRGQELVRARQCGSCLLGFLRSITAMTLVREGPSRPVAETDTMASADPEAG